MKFKHQFCPACSMVLTQVNPTSLDCPSRCLFEGRRRAGVVGRLFRALDVARDDDVAEGVVSRGLSRFRLDDGSFMVVGSPRSLNLFEAMEAVERI